MNMGVYQLSVLIWFYYVLTTPKLKLMDKPGDDDDHYDDRDSGGPDSGGHDSSRDDASGDASDVDERQHDLVVWNRELERLLKR